MTATVTSLRYAQPAPPAARPAGGPASDRVRSWLRQVMARGEGAVPIAPGRLALLAGVHPSTLTRFVNGQTDELPKMDTLDRIARAAGVPSPADLLTVEQQHFVDLPLVLPHVWLRNGGKVRETMAVALEAVRAPVRFSRCMAVKITADTGSLAGVLLGDTVLVDPGRMPELNDLVVVATDGGRAGIYRVQGHLLVPQAPGNQPSLDARTASVMGCAVQVQRELR